MTRTYHRTYSTNAPPSRANWDPDQPRECKRCGGKVTLKAGAWFRRFPVRETLHFGCVTR